MGIFDGVLLATDIDGTLLNSKNQLTLPVASAIGSFVERGGLFTIATGRSYAGFDALRKQIPLNAPVILSNGAYVYDYTSERELHIQWLSGPFEEALADILEAFPKLGTELHWPDRVCIINHNHWNDVHMNAVQCSFTGISHPSEAPPPWLKLLFVDEHETLKEVAAYAAERYAKEFSFSFSAKCLLEMQNTGIDKSVGVDWLAGHLSLEKKHVYTAGDAGNDIGMLRGFESFAPASATEEAKGAATHIVPSCDEDAIAAVIAILEERYSK